VKEFTQAFFDQHPEALVALAIVRAAEIKFNRRPCVAMGSGKVDPAKLTPGAHVLTNGTLAYPRVEEAIKAKD
jgi:hypothetical protein